jgi:eukaryotic-like serine/threonine-protein kinase
MKLGSRVWGIGKTLLLVGALGATFLLSFLVSMRLAMSAEQVQVPDLTNRTVSDATRLVGEAELRLRVDERHRPSTTVPEGAVVLQDPPAGADARPGRTIRVWLSAGAQLTSVPGFVGQTERAARFRLDQGGLIATVSAFRAPDYQADSVIAQVPAPAAQASKVALLVNRGEPATSYVMPDLVGTDGSRVEALLRSHGFRVTAVGSQPYPGIPAGTVVAQQPQAGHRVGPGDPVSLEVSR